MLKIQEEKMGKKVHVDEIVDRLVEVAQQILEYKIGVAMGEDPPEGHGKYNKEFQEYIVDFIKPMIKKSQQSREIEAQSTNDIIKMLSAGQISITQAVELISLLKDKLKVEKDTLTIDLQKSIMNQLGKE